MSDRLHSSEPAHVGHSRCQPDTRTSNPVLRGRTAIAKASNCCANSNSVFSPFNAAKATFALNAAVWFLRSGTQTTLPTSPHPRRRQRRTNYKHQCATLTIQPVQKIGQSTCLLTLPIRLSFHARRAPHEKSRLYTTLSLDALCSGRCLLPSYGSICGERQALEPIFSICGSYMPWFSPRRCLG